MEVCHLCEGSGLQVRVRADGSRVARECECRIARRQERALAAAKIPRLYEQSSFDSYETRDRDDRTYTLNSAKYHAEKFVAAYPGDTRGTGLLFTGAVGTGKTHLAVSVLKALILEKGASGIFFHFGELIKLVQNSYNRQVQTTELEILEPIIRAEILVLDEIGASKPSDWVFDTIAYILNSRYNDRRTTILTTNLTNREAVLVPGRTLTVLEESREALRNETLGDKIGERMRSRLQEMCIVVDMLGPDFRTSQKRARLA